MIKLKRITTKDKDLHPFMEALMKEAFPPEEYRSFDELENYSEQREEFYNTIIFDDNEKVGFLTFWDLGDFYYFEHLAISPTLRNHGHGHHLLKHLKENFTKPLVLEVEIPDNEMAKRRVKFYERNGFKLWENDYLQPPYRPTDAPLPMKLMVYGDLEAHLHFETIKDKMYKIVYRQ